MRRLSSILITFYLTAITISVASAQILPRPASVDSVVVDGIVADTKAADTTVVGSDGLPSADAFTTDVDTIAAPVDGSVTATGSGRDRKSTRLNSSHVAISYAVFCLK